MRNISLSISDLENAVASCFLLESLWQKRFGNACSVKTFSSFTADMLMFQQRCDSDNFIPCDLTHRNSAFAHGNKIFRYLRIASNYFAYIVSLLRPCLLLVPRIRLHKGRFRIQIRCGEKSMRRKMLMSSFYFGEESI